jgi:Leucine-rich repeat (LRR) protein
MRLPEEIAREVGSFLDRPSLTVCTTQLCWGGVDFVSRPSKDNVKVSMIRLQNLVRLCRTASEAPTADQEQAANGLATEAIKRIDLYLTRRTSAEKVVFVVNLFFTNATANTDFYLDIHHHFQVNSSLAVEWLARPESIAAVTFLLGERNGGRLNDVSALPSCPAVHTLDLSHTQTRDLSALASCPVLHTLKLDNTAVSDISALASCPALHTLILNNTLVRDVSALATCQALHTLDLNNTRVSDVSALASCQALHTLRLERTPVSDVSALASCQALYALYLRGTSVSDVSALAACEALRYVHGCEQAFGFGTLARLIENL